MEGGEGVMEGTLRDVPSIHEARTIPSEGLLLHSLSVCPEVSAAERAED